MTNSFFDPTANIYDPPDNLSIGIYVESSTNPELNGWVDFELSDWDLNPIFQTSDWYIAVVEGEYFQFLEQHFLNEIVPFTLEQLRELVEIVDDSQDAFNYFASNYLVETTIENFRSYYLGYFPSREDFAESYYVVDLPQNLQQFFDYESLLDIDVDSRYLEIIEADKGGVHAFRL